MQSLKYPQHNIGMFPLGSQSVPAPEPQYDSNYGMTSSHYDNVQHGQNAARVREEQMIQQSREGIASLPINSSYSVQIHKQQLQQQQQSGQQMVQSRGSTPCRSTPSRSSSPFQQQDTISSPSSSSSGKWQQQQPQHYPYAIADISSLSLQHQSENRARSLSSSPHDTLETPRDPNQPEFGYGTLREPTSTNKDSYDTLIHSSSQQQQQQPQQPQAPTSQNANQQEIAQQLQQQQFQQQLIAQLQSGALSQAEAAAVAAHLPPGSLLDVFHQRITDVGQQQQQIQQQQQQQQFQQIQRAQQQGFFSLERQPKPSGRNNVPTPGELQLKLFYEAITQSLNITVLKGANLLSLDGGGMTNPFVKVSEVARICRTSVDAILLTITLLRHSLDLIIILRFIC